MKIEDRKKYNFFPKIEGIITGIGVLLILELVTYFIYYNAVLAQKGEIFEGLYRTTRVINTLVDADKHTLLVKSDQENSDLYKNIIIPLKEALHSDTTIEFIYTMVQKDTLGDKIIYFILDAAEVGDSDGDGVDDKSHVMDIYEHPSKELKQCFNDTTITITKEVYYDMWGGHISCFTPLITSEKEFIGVLGVDISAKTFNERLKPIKRATQRAMITVFFISYLSGLVVWFLRNFSKKMYEILIHSIKTNKQDEN